MSNVKCKTSSRLLATILSLVMVLSMFPIAGTAVLAATNEHPDAVTITVKDDNGSVVEDAEVAFTIDSQTNGDLWKSETKQTDEYGCVEILPKADFIADDLTLTATVSKEGFETNETLADVTITSDDQNFEVVLISTTIIDVTIEGKTLTYNGAEQELVSITGLQDTDTVDYDNLPSGVTLNNEKKPVATNASTYELTVTVSRNGKEKLVKVTSTIEAANIEVDFNAKNPGYNEKAQELVSVTGTENIPDRSTVKWCLNSEEYSSAISDVPQATAVGEYTVELIIEGNSNYKKVDIQKTVNIIEGELNLDGLTVDGLNSVYMADENGDPVAQKAVKVTPESGHSYTLKYQLDDGDLTVNDSAWEEEIPTVTNAGSYIVWVKAVKDGYNESDVHVNPAAGAVAPYNVYIAKAEQSFAFDEYDAMANDTNPEAIELKGFVPYGQTYDFSATDDAALANGAISYEIIANEDVAEIAADGILTVNRPGAITVIATLSGNENYNECVIKYYLDVTGVVSANGQYIEFAESEKTFVIGTSNTISEQKAEKKDIWIMGDISYNINDVNGVSVNSTNGKIIVTDIDKLAEEIRNGNDEIVVTAKKEATKLYGADKISYKIALSFEATPAEPYTLSATDGTNDWYKNKATITPVAGYTIAQNASGTFSATTEFNNQGTDVRYVYLKNTETGAITDRIAVNIKVDSVNPADLKVEYVTSPINTLLEAITLGFYNPSVTLRFTAADDTSGLDYLAWTYTREAEQSETNLETETGTLTFADGKAELTLTASQAKQYRGNISFTVYDKAGNSTSTTDDGNVFVVDTISPTMTVKYAGAEPYAAAQNTLGDIHYFNGDVKVELTVTEANFYAEDVKVSVSKDGSEFSPVMAAWNDNNDNSVDVHTGTFTLSGDGDYVVKIEYSDKSDNAMTAYQSETITIDTTAPQVEIAYSRDGDVQKITFTVKEHNFRPVDVTITGTMQDITETDIPYTAAQLTDDLRNAIWKEIAPDTYQVEYDGLMNGIYDLTLAYKDLANLDAESFAAKFIIDHDAPTDVKIEYSKSILDTVLETVTLGFYKPDVTVTFTAFDTSSGVKNFQWRYTKQDGQSDVNRPTDDETKTVDAEPDNADQSKFTAQITLTATEAEQLRGYMSVIATDVYGNSSDKVTDEGYVLVVDTISPTMTAEYSKESRMVGTTAYYNGDATVTFTVNEANFFPEDVVVSVSKDNGTPYAVTPNWTDKSVDEHIGTYTLSGDGDYVVNVAYTDRSNNQMDSYTSHTITIDTIKPVISVEYQNTNLIDTVKDRDEKDRKYFDDTQTAIVTINEHNFNADEVDFQIVAQDVTGKELDASALNTKSQWSVGENGDIHIITITYPGDANYTFDVDYTDLATNQADDYAPDYFTVDKTAPTNLTVSYSTSVLDTVLESLSFGFYNAKMTVTLTADDITSGVHNFKYSYLNAAGVSSVNAELIDQAIEAADIVYSEDGLTATMTFEIPKMVLGTDNQFNGTVEFTATDRAGNETDAHKETKRIVVDNISPTAQVTYNEAANVVGDISYYNGNIEATITINEANFYANDVQVTVSKDNGAATAVTPTWTDSSVDVHVGRFTLTEDGDYIVTINYTDKSSNRMDTYISKQMTIDTQIEVPTYTVNGVAKTEIGGAYKGDATIGFNFADQNFDTQTIKLTRTRLDSVEDVTDAFINVSGNDQGGSGSFTIPSEVGNDGIYDLTITIKDKALHETESSLRFTINRFGSVYEYSDELVALIKDGGQYVQSVDGDLVITEYNADRILEGSLKILITRDGENVDVDFTSNPTNINSEVGIGDSGWYQYVYTIKASNFETDGVYKISLTSEYGADDSERNESTSIPDNSIDDDGNAILDTMNFTVDSVAPEIRNIVNMDQKIADVNQIVDGKLNVKYTVVDVGGLKSIEIKVNGTTVQSLTEEDLADSAYNYSGSFDIEEQSGTTAQKVQLIVTDRAGNVTDTNSDDFLKAHSSDNENSTFVFFNEITVSRNFFVRWYANTPLFWGSIGGVVVLAGAILFFIAFKKKKKEEKAK